GVVRLWDALSGRLRAELTGHEQRVFSLAFTPDGALLASSDAGGHVRFWDVGTGRTVEARLPLPRNSENPSSVQVAFSPGKEAGYLLAPARSGKQGENLVGTFLWPLGRGPEPGTLTVGQPRELSGSGVGKMTFVDQGRAILVEGNGSRLYETASG